MSSIDEVIARSRQPGEFQERKTFTVARGRAIQKLRDFALVDSHFYILELIQSAVSNGATYIDIQCDKRSVSLSYVGGNFEQEELAQLFDFLFASRDDVEHGALRQLALGVNALMKFAPEQIIIETGDGTQLGTHRVEIKGDDSVDIGRPAKALKGTYLRAQGLSASGDRVTLFDGRPKEFEVVEERCLAAPVPILFNHEPLFGYSRQRSPENLFGYHQTLNFDEGDFYGAIGTARRRSKAVFRLLTHGVWIESKRHDFGAHQIDHVGGVIAFDGLQKTADHSSIVEDGRLQEMWLRLLPYVKRLIEGDDADLSTVGLNVRTLADERLSIKELLELVQEVPRLVVVTPRVFNNTEIMDRARKVGASLDAPVLAVAVGDMEAMTSLLGGRTELLAPDLDNERQVQFYLREPQGVPRRPWLVSPVDLGTMSLLDVGQNFAEQNWMASSPAARPTGQPAALGVRDDDDEFVGLFKRKVLGATQWLLGSSRGPDKSLVELEQYLEKRFGESIRGTLYTPVEDRELAQHNLEIRQARRVVWSGHCSQVLPGQHLVVDVQGVELPTLWARRGDEKSAAQWIGEAVASRNLRAIDRASQRALAAALRSDIEPGSNAATLVLSALVNRLVKRIRSAPSGPRISFSLVHRGMDASVLSMKILKTLSGRSVSITDLEELMVQCQGLIYAVKEGVDADLEGLDKERILAVDGRTEQLLIALVGPTAYVRVDDREVLARSAWLVVRDVALGLRDYPEFGLLVEGGDPRDWSSVRQAGAIEELSRQLVDIIGEEAQDGSTAENRRQAWRHLQRLVICGDRQMMGQQVAQRLDDLPLFRLAGDRTCSWADLRQALAERPHLEMLDGWAVGAGEMSLDEALKKQVHSPQELSPLILTMNPFVMHLLGDGVQGCVDYDLSDRELAAFESQQVESAVMVEQIYVDDERMTGVLGLPLEAPQRPAILVFGAEEREVILRDDLGAESGVVGKIRLRKGISHDDISQELGQLARDVVAHLLAQIASLSEGGGQPYQRALAACLQFVEAHLEMVASADGTVRLEVGDRLAREILSAPILPGPSGTLVSLMSVLAEFRDQAGRALWRGEPLTFESSMVADDIPEAVTQWMQRILRLENISQPGRRQRLPKAPGPGQTTADSSDQGDENSPLSRLGYWLARLDPTTAGAGDRGPRFVVAAAEDLVDQEATFCQLEHRAGPQQQRRLLVNEQHWLMQWMASDEAEAPQALAWALMAAFAHINEVLEPVGNEEELAFQQWVMDALEQGLFALAPAGTTDAKGAPKATAHHEEQP